MRFRPASRAVMTGVSLVVTWVTSGRPAQADILVGSTIIPTSSVMTTSYLPTSYVPTSYGISTSSYLPTSYVVPTSTILPTSSIIETSSPYYLPTTGYVTTSFRRRLFQPRRFVERTSYYASPTSYLTPTVFTPTSYITPTTYLSSSALLPTSYVVPTTTYLPTTYVSRAAIAPTSYLVDDGLIATTALASTSPCGDSAPTVMAAPADPTPTRAMAPRPSTSTDGSIISRPQSTGAAQPPAERAPSATIRPAPADDDKSSDVTPGIADPPAPAAPLRANPGLTTPPEVPRPIDTSPVPLPGSIGKDPKDSRADERIDRTSMRPNYAATRSKSRNILSGRVVSFESGQPEEAVKVILQNQSGYYKDKATYTNADGEFKITLPDGDWAVKVTMPSSTVYDVGRDVVASGGKVVDLNGRNVGEFIIKR